MQWLQVTMSVLALMMTTGCPSEFGREGRVAKAVHNDSLGIVRKNCSDDERRAVCGPGQERSEACLECGG
jgi:hypothetical protein